MARPTNKETAKIIALVKAQRSRGWDYRMTKGSHYLITLHGTVVGGLPGTPSDFHSIGNSVAALRRAGLEIPRKAQKRKGAR